MILPKLVWKDRDGSLVPGKTLIPMSDLERNNRLLENNNKLLERQSNTILFYGAVILIIIMFVIWKFYSTGYFNSLLARCGG